MLIIVVLMLYSVYGITFDTNYYIFGDCTNQDLGCSNGQYHFETINFSSAFTNIPQVILVREFSDLAYATSQEVQMIFSIYQVTTTYVQLYIQCNQLPVHCICVRWYAIDDQRIQVINQWNVANFQSQTFDNQNPNAVAGFVSIIAIGYKGPISFNITIAQITSTKVSIQFDNPQNLIGNVVSVGYQIVLAAQEQLNILNTIRTTSKYTSAIIDYVPNTFFLIPHMGYEYTNQDNFRLSTFYQSTNPIQYVLDTWGGYYPINTQKQIQILQPSYYSQTYLPLFCNHFQVFQKVDPSSTPSTQVKMTIIEMNQSIVSISSSTIVLKKELSTVNFIFIVNCLETQSVKSQFYIYVSQTRQIQQNTYQHKCTSQYRLISYRSRFKQQTSAAQKLQIVITSNSLTITQIIYNQSEITSQQLVAIQVI